MLDPDLVAWAGQHPSPAAALAACAEPAWYLALLATGADAPPVATVIAALAGLVDETRRSDRISPQELVLNRALAILTGGDGALQPAAEDLDQRLRLLGHGPLRELCAAARSLVYAAIATRSGWGGLVPTGLCHAAEAVRNARALLAILGGAAPATAMRAASDEVLAALRAIGAPTGRA